MENYLIEGTAALCLETSESLENQIQLDILRIIVRHY